MNKLNMIKGLMDVQGNVPVVCLDTQNNVYEIVSLNRVVGPQDETMAILAYIKKDGEDNGIRKRNTGESLFGSCDHGNPSDFGILDCLPGVR